MRAKKEEAKKKAEHAFFIPDECMLIIETSSFLKEALSVPKTVLLSSHTRNMHLYTDAKTHFHRPTRGAGAGTVTLITCVRANSEICLYPSQTGFWGLLGKGGEDR